MESLRTDYEGHEAQYQRRLAAGYPGWAPSYERDLASLEAIFQHPRIPRQGRLIELGCGAGNQSLWLAQRGYDAEGIDIAPTAIAHAQEQARFQQVPAQFRVGNVLDLSDYPDQAFDIVLDGHCLHCMIGMDRGRFLANAYRILKPGGILLIDTMCGDIKNQAMRPHFDPVSRCLVIEGVAIRYHGLPDAILQELQAQQFELVEWMIEKAAGSEDEDTLIVVATKP